jgi:hypothetical protein
MTPQVAKMRSHADRLPGFVHDRGGEGSGNVFADIGMAEPEQALAKAKLAAKIAIAIEEEQLTQAEAAERLGTDGFRRRSRSTGRTAGAARWRTGRGGRGR